MIIIILFLALALVVPSTGTNCNIPRVQLDETREYINIDTLSSPVVYVLDKLRNSRMRSSVARASLLANHGDAKVTLSSSNSYSHDTRRVSLKEYITTIVDVGESKGGASASERFYMFGHNEGSEPWRSLIATYVRPPCGPICSGSNATPTLGIGASGSGTSLHFHGPAFAETIIGRKRWFIYPLSLRPDMDSFANMSMKTWAEDVYPTLPDRDDIYDCTISPGELLFFPSQFLHATLNLDAYNVFMSLFV